MMPSDRNLAINGGKPIRKKLIPLHLPYLDKNDLQAVISAFKTTFISGDGPDCRKFEEKLSEYLNIKYVFYTSSCTASLDLAYMTKNFPANSEVIVPNFTFTSTALAPILNNLTVRLADVDSSNGNIDVNNIESLINEKTVAISPVDYAGNPADMDKINQIAKKYNLYVVHDTAQSIGAKYKGKKTGTLGDVSCFSFHGTKNITTGEGGAIVTNSDILAQKIRMARDKGTDKYDFISDSKKKGFYEYVTRGNSYIQSNLLGALGITQLDKIDFINKKREQIANYYINELSAIKSIRFPTTTPGGVKNWHIFILLVPSEYRLWIIEALKYEGIGSNVHYTPLHMNQFYNKLNSHDDFPNSIKFFNSLIRIPLYPGLADNEVEDIVKGVKKVFSAINMK